MLGDVVNIQHLEPIGFYHFAHSFVRGAWGVEAKSSFLLLTKCCHDMDLLVRTNMLIERDFLFFCREQVAALQFNETAMKPPPHPPLQRYMVGRPITRLSSFGSLVHLRPEKRPALAGATCVTCPAAVEAACPFSALKIYREPAARGNFNWPVAPILSVAPSLAAVDEALRSGPYGRCAYACDNDVCDNQVVNIEFEGGATASLTTVAYTEKLCQRNTRIFCTRGELEGDGESSIRTFDFNSRVAATHTIGEEFLPAGGTSLSGHGGADFFLISSFVRAVAAGDASLILSGPDETLDSHLAVFAAEESRRRGGVVDMREAGGAGAALPAESAAAAAKAREW